MTSIIQQLRSLPQKNNPYVNKPGMFDLFKGYAMLSIIITHTIQACPDNMLIEGAFPNFKKMIFSLYDLITFGHVLMPIFFMISGFGIKATPPKKLLKNQANYLIKPVVVVFLLSIPFSFIFHYLFTMDYSYSVLRTIGIIKSFLLGIVIQDYSGPIPLPGISTFWFVLALFWGNILINTIIRQISERYHLMLVSIICFLTTVLSILVRFNGISHHNNFAIASSFIAVFFLYAGYVIKKNKLLNIYIHPMVYLILSILWLIQTNFSVVNINYPDAGLGFIDIITSTLFSFIFIRLTLYIDSKAKNFVCDFLHFVGRYSLWILSIHAFEFLCIPWSYFINNYFHKHALLKFLILCLIRISLNLIVLKFIIFIKKLFKPGFSN